MSEELKNLDHYLANPDELAALSDAQLDTLSQQKDEAPPVDVVKADEKPAEIPEKKGEAGTEKPAEAPAGAAPEKATDAPEQEQPDILSKDGKHVIPYWRLAEAEARAREAADKAAQLEQQLAEQIKSGKAPGKDTQPQAPDYAAIDAQLGDFPELQTAFRASHARIEQLTGALNSLNSRFQQMESQQQARSQNDAQEAQQSVDAAIAATPKLAYLQRTGEDGKMADPAAWDRAVNIDVMLRGQPEWKGQSFADRFAKVVAVYEAMYGPIPLQIKQEAPPPAKEDGKKPAKLDVPTSMSAIPGGVAPPVDELAAVANKSGVELTSRYMSMTPEQIEAELNRL